MALTSPEDKQLVQELSEVLTPDNLLDLACDLLFIRGHTNIRITDGPGDGKRDIHSIDSSGNNFVTQCKYHKDAKLSVGTRDTAELPIALIKLDCDSGLFITNARISPQSKREYLNDYPKLTLDFLDGLAIIRELRTNILLQTRWLDGTGKPSPHVVTYPVIIRQHDNDLPIIPSDLYGDVIHEEIALSIKNIFSKIEISLSTDWISEDEFGAYREPKKITHEEGFSPRLKCTLVRITNISNISIVETLPQIIANAFTSCIGIKLKRFSILIGMPSLISLSGSSPGSTIRINEDCFCLVKTNNTTLPERDFLSLENEFWTSETDAQQTDAHAIRLYSSELDVCLSVTHLSRVSRFMERTKRAIRLYGLERWNLSIHTLSTTDPEDWTLKDIQKPDETIPWPYENSWLCTWLHKGLLGGPISFPSSSHRQKSFSFFDEDEEIERLNRIRSAIKTVEEISPIDPARARHILTLVSYDPFEEENEYIFNTADLILEEDSGLPSPALPSARNLRATIFLRGIEINNLIKIVQEILTSRLATNDLYNIQEKDQSLCVQINLDFKSTADLSTTELLSFAYSWLSETIDEIKKRDIKIESWTKQAWKESTGVSLATNWRDSEKVYVKLLDDEGNVRELRGVDNPLEQDWNPNKPS